MENTTKYQSIGEWNAAFSTKLIPDSIVLIFYLVIGLVGNLVVIYLYQRHLKGKDRYFIQSLAVVDLLSSVFNTSLSFSINMLPVSYDNDAACKIMCFICMSLTLASALMLLAIAVYRYIKICKPFGPQMNVRWKNAVIALVVLISVLLSFPCFFFYGAKPVLHPNGSVSGHRCTSVRGPWSQTEPLVFKTTLMMVVCVVSVSLIVLYSLLGRTLYNQIKFRKENNYPHSSDSTCKDSGTDGKPSTEHLSEEGKAQNKDIENISSNKPTKPQKNKETGFRLSILFMLISFIFIACYIPKTGMMIWESRHENFWTGMTTSELGIYRFLYTLFIINNIVNPFLYGIFDSAFRKEFKKTFCCSCR